MHAGPRVVLWYSGHPCSHGISFDVPIDSQQVVVRRDQARLESALPQGAGAAMSVVEHLHVALRRPAKSRGRRTGERRSRQQMHVVAHQHICVNRKTALTREKSQQAQIMMPIFIVDEYGAPVNASVRNVQRNSGEVQSWSARHSASSVSIRSMDASIHARYRTTASRPVRKRLGLNCLRPLFSFLFSFG
jgi:hypothetical protein